MKNPVVFYAIIAIGVIGLIAGAYFMAVGHHPLRAGVGLGVGALLLIAGIVGMFMTRSRSRVVVK
ncbi:MAG: hypothetical protein H0W02_01390 [Ktedonobacteraceae bacterium]|nr:hypothetical protein [Ktedonobacteraceae bacterium]